MPRIGNNGGLMGPRRTSTAISASGIWNLNEQKIAKGAGIWPEISEIVPSDPYWSNVKLLLHMDGSNGSTNFVDSSNSTLVTADFSAQISTAQSKFGDASGSFNGTTDTLTFSPIDIGSAQDFTLEAFIRPSSNTDHGIFYSPTSGNVQVLSLVNGKLECYMAIQSSGVVLQMTGATTVTTDTWHHVALTRNGNYAYLYLDGALDATIGMHSGAFSITVLGFAQYRGRFNGYIDEVRITVGTARYTGSSFIPPTAPFPNTGPDLYWDNVTLLLHMNGNNGSTALIDSSSRAISFTANSDAQISTTQSKFGGSSAYFDGSGDSFSTTNLSPFEFGAGDFTVECWVYMTSLGTYNGIIDTRSSASFDNLVFGIWNVDGTLRPDHASSNSSARLTATSTSVSLNTWTHVAWTRHNGTIACFVNGVKDATTVSNSNVINPGGTTAYIGQVIDPTYFNGYIDELRITEGVARYKADFLPPNSSFSDIGPSGQPSEDPYWGDVSLLLHMDGSNGSTVFADSSNYNLVVTANGNAQISTAQRRFGGASGYFDGSGDYLSIPDNSVLEPGDSDFTWEFWVKTTTTTEYATLFSRMPSGNGPSKWTLMTNRYGPTRGDLALYVGDYSASTELLVAEGHLTSAWKITDGAWHHVAVVRNGAEWAIYVDGISRATATWAGAISDSTSPITIGRDDYYSGRDFEGYIDDFRVTKAARYTSNFTRPAAPFPNTGPVSSYLAMTSLLLHMNGSNGSTTFTDSSPNSHAITSLGGLISTAQSKFGSGSLRVQTDQCIETPSSSTFSFPGDFTIEMWFKADGTQLTTYKTLFELGGYSNGILLRDDALYVNGNILKSGVNLLSTTWRHIAVVRVGTTIKLFINGVDQGANTFAVTGIVNGYSSPIKFGEARHTSGQQICGWIDEVRIIKGAALYTADFSPPAAPFLDASSPVVPIDPYLDNVSLLLHMDGSNGSTTFTDSSNNALTVTANGNAQISTAQSKFGGASGYFDGANDYLEAASLSLDLQDFTVECWVRLEAITDCAIFNQGNSDSTGNFCLAVNSANGRLYLYADNGSRFSSTTSLSTGTWSHVALTRQNQNYKLFIDGVLDGSYTGMHDHSGTPFKIANGYGGITQPNGYIDDFRVTKGICRYSTNFIPPTAPFPNIDPEPVVTVNPYWANVSLLLRMDGSNGSTAFTDLSDYGHSVTANGSAQVTTADPKFGTGALVLSATSSDYLSTPANSAFEFGTEDFTVECWVYLNSYHSNNGLFTFGGTSSGLALAVYSGNWTLTDAGSGGTSMGPAATLEWQHIAITRIGTIVKMFVNGVQIGSSLTVTTSFLDPSNSLKIGYYYNSSYGINAKIDEFRVTKGVSRYSANFTPPTAPFPSTEAVNPIPALNPVLWYDFADEATVTTSGTEITAVTDKGSRGWTLTSPTNKPTYVTGINGKKCLDWGASPSHSAFMYNSDTTSTTIGEVYVVVDASFGGTASNYAGLFTSYNNAWYILAIASSLENEGTGFNQLFVNGGTSNRFSGGLFTSPSIDNPAIMRINNSSSTTFNTTGGFEIGNDRGNSSLNRGWCGLIGEYIVFSSVLSSTDRATVENYLSAKWGITLG